LHRSRGDLRTPRSQAYGRADAALETNTDEMPFNTPLSITHNLVGKWTFVLTIAIEFGPVRYVALQTGRYEAG